MKPLLFAPATAVRKISEARAIAILIGGYDGSGNYGDIALLEAALDLVSRLGPDVLVLSLLERACREDHQALAASGGMRASEAIYFDPANELEDDLLPVAAPVELAAGACYLYGGGYLNRSWGDRKLAMLHAAEALLVAGDAAQVCRISSGLQVEAGWVADLAEADADALRSLDFLGVRDGSSTTALEALGLSAVSNTGDDAVAVLGPPGTSSAPPADGQLRINLHLAEHPWVSDHPEQVIDFYTEFVAELKRLASGTVAVQPLIAYRDRRTDDGVLAQRMADRCTALGAEVAEPLVLRPGSTATTPLREADLTLSCSYHVALTSLMAGIPAALLGDSPYYAQKAAGLAEDFDLPPAFMITGGSDAVTSAREIVGPLLDQASASVLRQRLAWSADRLRNRRAAAELELLGRLGEATTAALCQRIDELGERLRQRSAEPAELHERLADLQTELEELRHRTAADSPLEAELRAQEAAASAAAAQQALAVVLGSRSWRLAAPLRRIKALLSRN